MSVDRESDATGAFIFDGDGCLIRAMDAGGTWHTMTTCKERGVTCKCVRV